MAPSAIDPSPENGRQQAVISPPHLFNVSEAHFEQYLAPQPDGYGKAQRRGSDNVAIVIDNGKPNYICAHSLNSLPAASICSHNVLQVLLPPELAGRSKMPHDLAYPRCSRNTATGK